MKRRQSPTRPDDNSPGFKRTRRDAKAASLLTLPRELRDQIYELVIPYGNIHISYQADSIQGSSRPGQEMTMTHVKGKGFTRKVCVSDKRDDHAEAQKWIDGGPHVYGIDHETRHERCLFDYPHRHPQPIWPFALLFVSRQVHNELLETLYKRCSFSFRDSEALEEFAARTPKAQLGLISDLRVGLRMGSGGDDLFHHNAQDAVALCRSFTGLRKLHASLALRFYDVRHLRDIISTDWKISHWARGILNFAYHPLEEVTIMLEEDDTMHRRQSAPMMYRHRPKQEEIQGWARSIRDQLLAPWDRDAALTFLQRHQTQENKYHRKICGSHWAFEPLAAPHERIP